MISVVDGDPPPLLDPPGSASVSRSASESGFVHVIRFGSFTTTRGLIEENVELVMDGWLVRVMVVCSASVAGRSGGGPERTENEEGDIGGDINTVVRRVIRLGRGGGLGIGIGGK